MTNVGGFYDFGIIGGGIIGAASSAFLAEAGASVVLFERDAIAAAASGRNSGSIQHPFDPPMAALYRKSVALYRELQARGSQFAFPREAGLLVVSFDQIAVHAAAATIDAHSAELEAQVIDADALQSVEPALAPGLTACRISTGYPVAPAAATRAFAERAARAGAEIRTGTTVRPALEHGRAVGIEFAGRQRVACGNVLIAAGPWTPGLVPGWSALPPITPLWGVVVTTRLRTPPVAVIEELGIDRPDGPPARLFSAVSVAGQTSIGSTFLPERPDEQRVASEVIDRARAFIPAVEHSAIEGVRACARPVSRDGRATIGAVPGVERLYVCAGHGPWGISTGPASAAVIVDVMLEKSLEPPEFSPLRFVDAPINTEFA